MLREAEDENILALTAVRAVEETLNMVRKVGKNELGMGGKSLEGELEEKGTRSTHRETSSEISANDGISSSGPLMHPRRHQQLVPDVYKVLAMWTLGSLFFSHHVGRVQRP